MTKNHLPREKSTKNNFLYASTHTHRGNKFKLDGVGKKRALRRWSTRGKNTTEAVLPRDNEINSGVWNDSALFLIETIYQLDTPVV